MAVGFVLQACEALGHAHAAGIVHRDVKPSNFFLVPRDDGAIALKVLDFGIAKEVEGKRVTHTSEVFGSPEYMSPEQVRATKDVDARSDIWALGVCLYELASGRLPFEGTSVFEAGSKILFERHKPLSEIAPQVPLELSAIVDQCLEKRPERRYASTQELAEALETCCAGRAVARQAAEAEARAATFREPEVPSSSGSHGASAPVSGTRPSRSADASVPAFFARRAVGHAAFVLLALSGLALGASLWRAKSRADKGSGSNHAAASSVARASGER
jgi:serine/threonine-protein kinase